MKELNVLITGLGGQGVVFITRLLAQTAILLDQPVMVSESHGMSQRSGSVASHLKVGGNQAPLIRKGTADVLLGLESGETLRNLAYLRQGGTVFANTEDGLHPEVNEHLARLEIRALYVPANIIAVDLGSAAVANVVLVGFAAADESFPFPLPSLKESIDIVARRGKSLNMSALDAGYRLGLARGERNLA
jgi:indolepyruvate ferredoxin oxidoreductase beta subunit